MTNPSVINPAAFQTSYRYKFIKSSYKLAIKPLKFKLYQMYYIKGCHKILAKKENWSSDGYFCPKIYERV